MVARGRGEVLSLYPTCITKINSCSINQKIDPVFDSLLTAFFVGINGAINVLLIPNSRLSRKVAKNPLLFVKNPYKYLIVREDSRINVCK